MAPFLIGNIASAALSALSSSSGSSQADTPQDPFNQLVQRLTSTAGAEKTVTKPDGSSVTTVPASGGDRVVAETSASGQTLTEAGYVSPVLLNNFLNNLFGSLQSTQSGAGTTSISSSVQSLETKLQAGTSSSSGLVTSFNNLMQGSGINLPSGTSPSTALQQFLSHAAPAIDSGQVTRQGIKVSA